MTTDRETSQAGAGASDGQAEDPSHATSEPGNAGAEGSHHAKNDASWLHLGKEGAAVLQGFVQLALLEVALTIKTIPKMIGAGIGAVFFLVWAWLSLCVVAAWASYLASGWSILAPITFFAMQLLGAGACGLVIKKGAKRLGIPNTKRQWTAFKEAIHGHSANH